VAPGSRARTLLGKEGSSLAWRGAFFTRTFATFLGGRARTLRETSAASVSRYVTAAEGGVGVASTECFERLYFSVKKSLQPGDESKEHNGTPVKNIEHWVLGSGAISKDDIGTLVN